MQHLLSVDIAANSQQRFVTYAAKPNYRDRNASLNRYLEQHVRVDREKRDLISREVLPLVKELLVEINAQDERFGKEILRVGSSTQGLSVNTNGDYDFSVIFKLDPNEDPNHPSSLLSWSNQETTPMQYGFKDSEENETSSLRKNLKIGRKEVSRPHPGFGYSNIGLPLHWPYTAFDYSDLDDSDFDDSNFDDPDFKDLQCHGELIPNLVKCRFKRLLQDALDNLGLKDDLKLFRYVHGPALTLRSQVTTDDGKTHSVSIDLAIIIRAGLQFLPEMGWPVLEISSPVPLKPRTVSYTPRTVQIKPWPPPDKVDAILNKGINVVAKKPFFWYVSFVELEKELVSEIDIDGGCRKKVHRVMKSVFYTVCKERPVLTSYMLKNVWFLECEKYPDIDSWQPENLWERYYNCLHSLREYVRQRRLPQYFNRSVNLLENKNVEEDVERIIGFDFEKAVSKKRRAEEESDLQPPLKISKGLVSELESHVASLGLTSELLG